MEVKPTPEYEKQYLDASYNAADCWHKYAIAQSTDANRKKMLASGFKSIKGTAAMMPSLGGANPGSNSTACIASSSRRCSIWA